MSAGRPALFLVAALVSGATACAWFESTSLPPAEGPDPRPPSPTDKAPSGVPSADAPDVVLITLDTTRADHLKRYGYFRDTMPHLEALADGAVVFDQLVVPMATTLPSHTSLLTGVWPEEHGVLANVEHGGQRFIPSERLQSLATLLAAQGYQTAAFTSAAPLNAESGIQRGFQTFGAAPKAERTGDHTTRAALKWLQDASASPLFLWVHYYDPHNPWIAPSRYTGAFGDDHAARDAWMDARKPSPVTRRPTGERVNARAALEAYDAELRFMDDQIADLIDGVRARGRWDQTVVVVVGDHGEGLNQHDEPGHGQVWHEQLHAPLFVIAPGAAPRRVPTVLSMADVFPTVLGLTTIPGAEAFVGQASGEDVLAPGFVSPGVLSQTSKRQQQFGVPLTYTLTGAPLKCAWSAEAPARLWDLALDPFELAPVDDASALDACVARGRALLEAQKAHGALIGGQVQTLSEEEIARLRELGYLAPDAAPSTPGTPPPDVQE